MTEICKIEGKSFPKIYSFNFYLDLLTLSTLSSTEHSFQPVPSGTIVLFTVTALPRQAGL